MSHKTRYVALLRGINVGGKGIIKMQELKKIFEDLGCLNVSTYINSGNVIFETNGKITHLISGIEKQIAYKFGFESKIVIRTKQELQETVDRVPSEWNTSHDIRCYVAFVREPLTEKEVLKEIKPKEGVDSVSTHKGVLFLTTLTSGLTKSGFTKLIGTKIYKDITIRNYNTVKKILSLISA